MVGKVWSDLEEKYFWRTAVAQSSKRAGIDRANGEKTWDQLASEMHRAMERQGGVRRMYTSTMLFEHYFQNIEGERRSPNATAYVNEYLAKLGPHREIVNPRSKRPRRVSTESTPKASQLPLPSTGTTRSPQNEDAAPSLESVGRQKPRSSPRRATRTKSHRSTGTASRLSSRPSLPLRPIAPAGKQAIPPLRSAGLNYSNPLPYVNRHGVLLDWDRAPPMPFTPDASSYQYPAAIASRPSNGHSSEDVVWGYQMGKRSAPGPLPAYTSCKSQKTSAGGVAGRSAYADFQGGYEMGERPAAQSHPISSPALPQINAIGRAPSEYSTENPQSLQQEPALGYRMGQHPSPASLSGYSSYTTTYASSLSRTASNDSADEALFVEEDRNSRDGAPEGAGVSNGIETQAFEDARSAKYRGMGRGGIINWDDGNVNYDVAKGRDYIPETGGSY
ncbi:hypothetical protein F4776DRAFT_662345 [Hypoxylon sp. NC0597]|nr:hypothetical protein F4776DRAFT_662345 [Hypoxylon sp. NC0597]